MPSPTPTFHLHLPPNPQTHPPSRKVLASLTLLKITPTSTTLVRLSQKEDKTREYLALSPSRTLPCAVIDGDLVLTESNAIVVWAGEERGRQLQSMTTTNGEINGKTNGDTTKETNNNNDSPHYPTDLIPSASKRRADILRWLFWETSVWTPSCSIYLEDEKINPSSPSSALKKEDPNWRSLAAVLENTLLSSDNHSNNTKTNNNNDTNNNNGHPTKRKLWLCGGPDPSLADLAVASSMGSSWRRAGFPVEGFPALRRWVGRVEGLGCWGGMALGEGE